MEVVIATRPVCAVLHNPVVPDCTNRLKATYRISNDPERLLLFAEE